MALYTEIVELLKTEEKQDDVKIFAKYCEDLKAQKKKDRTTGDWVIANPWMQRKPVADLISMFRKVKAQGLNIDGKHITIQSTGISLDYIAYKNKMLLMYPESKIDVGVVYKNDTFTMRKDSGKIIYEHLIADPFVNNEKEIIGAYAVIKNNRGENGITLSSAEIEKHKKVAKTGNIWRDWFKEMVLKTVIKKAVKFYSDDEFEKIIEEDNKENDLEQVSMEDENVKKFQEAREKINNATTQEKLKEIYLEYKDYKLGESFLEFLTLKKQELINETNEN